MYQNLIIILNYNQSNYKMDEEGDGVRRSTLKKGLLCENNGHHLDFFLVSRRVTRPCMYMLDHIRVLDSKNFLGSQNFEEYNFDQRNNRRFV